MSTFIKAHFLFWCYLCTHTHIYNLNIFYCSILFYNCYFYCNFYVITIRFLSVQSIYYQNSHVGLFVIFNWMKQCIIGWWFLNQGTWNELTYRLRPKSGTHQFCGLEINQNCGCFSATMTSAYTSQKFVPSIARRKMRRVIPTLFPTFFLTLHLQLAERPDQGCNSEISE